MSPLLLASLLGYNEGGSPVYYTLLLGGVWCIGGTLTFGLFGFRFLKPDSIPILCLIFDISPLNLVTRPRYSGRRAAIPVPSRAFLVVGYAAGTYRDHPPC